MVIMTMGLIHYSDFREDDSVSTESTSNDTYLTTRISALFKGGEPLRRRNGGGFFQPLTTNH